MKIIADMGGDKFLVEANGDEIANIIGVYGSPAAPFLMTEVRPRSYSSDRRFRVGAEFNVSPAYHWLKQFKERRAEALKSTAIMRAFLDHVDGNIPVICPEIVLTPDDVKATEVAS